MSPFQLRKPVVHAFGVAAAVAALLAPATAGALPDLVPEISDLSVIVRDVIQGDVDEGCAGGRFDRRLVSYSLRTRNVGNDDLFLGSPGCPNCSTNPGAACTNPLFVCGTSHGHAHFEDFARNEILDSEGNVVAEGLKYGFCLLDQSCGSPQYSCSFQGISAGCSDVYSAGLPCQYVDITEETLPDGLYRIRVHIDPENVFPETDEANNILEVPFTIGETNEVCPVYESSDVPKAIPSQGLASSTLTLPDVGAITSMRLRMKGTHTYLGDLVATLESPASTTRTLFSNICAGADNFGLYLGDDAVGPLVCPATDGSILRMPEQSFSVFEGEDAAGIWTLAIEDEQANDSGSLAEWSLEICTECGNGVVDAGEVCDDGNAQGGDCCASDCQAFASDGSTCVDDDFCTLAETCQGGACVPGGEVTCDPCLVCEPDDGCVVPDVIYPCQDAPAGKSTVRIRRDDSDPELDNVMWKWRSQTPVELDEFGAPQLSTALSLCIYGGEQLLLSSTIDAAADCDGESCWSIRDHDAKFSDRSGTFEGLTFASIREGLPGKITMKGSGIGLALPPLDVSLPVTVRLRRGDGTPCWQAEFAEAQSSTATRFKARSR
jgi:subtilisin-like proprotein convertase family protein